MYRKIWLKSSEKWFTSFKTLLSLMRLIFIFSHHSNLNRPARLNSQLVNLSVYLVMRLICLLSSYLACMVYQIISDAGNTPLQSQSDTSRHADSFQIQIQTDSDIYLLKTQNQRIMGAWLVWPMGMKKGRIMHHCKVEKISLAIVYSSVGWKTINICYNKIYFC